MKNIIWKKPDGGFAVTSIADVEVNSTDYAADLKSSGTIPADWTIHAVDSDVPPKPLAEVKAEKLAQIKAARDEASVANVTVHGRQWQADQRSQKLLNDAITLAIAGLPLPPVWRDVANDSMPITSIADLMQIAGAIVVQTQAAYVKSWELKTLVDAATTVAEVEAVSW